MIGRGQGRPNTVKVLLIGNHIYMKDLLTLFLALEVSLDILEAVLAKFDISRKQKQ